MSAKDRTGHRVSAPRREPQPAGPGRSAGRLWTLRSAVAVLALAGLAAYATGSFVVSLYQGSYHNAGNLVRYYRERLAPLKPMLPADVAVGYVTDESQGSRAYYLARYALSPARLLYDTPCELNVGDFHNPAITNAALGRAGFEVVRDCGNGVKLLRRRAPLPPSKSGAP